MASSNSDSEWEEVEIMASSIVIGDSLESLWVHDINEQREKLGEFSYTVFTVVK